MPHRACLLLLLCMLAPCAYAGEGDTLLDENLDGLSGAAALEVVKELAADAMKGRKTAFEGGALVENWMLEKMSEFGLHPADAGGTYLEPFTYGASTTVAPIALTVGAQKLNYGEDYYDLTYSGSGKVSAEAVFVGYGIARPDVGWDDYAGLDVKGKVVIAIRGAPEARASEFTRERFIGYKSATAADRGAAGFLLVQDASASTGTIQDRFFRAVLPALWLSGKVADTVFAHKQRTLAALKKLADEGTPGNGFATGVQVAMEVNAQYLPRAKGHNALGAIKGRDPDLKGEVVLVGAHMDHLGVAPDGEVFHGADDNASGTAVLIHLADVLTRNRFRPKRTIVFCAFGAEEQGLFGSESLAARYPFPGKVVCVLNMDMVGQGEPIVRVDGGDSYPVMRKVMQDVLPADVARLAEFGPRTGPGSDHWPFHERGVPAFGISTKGEHPNYHSPKDVAANIKPDCLEAAARVVGSLIVKLAMYEQPLYADDGMAQYVTREGPRFGHGIWLTDDSIRVFENSGGGPTIGLHDTAAIADLGLACVLVPVHVQVLDGWQGFAKRVAEADAGMAIAHRAADVERAWQKGKLAVLPQGLCAESAAASREQQIAAFGAAGIRLVSPFDGLKSVDEDAAKALLAACRAARVLPVVPAQGPHAPLLAKLVGDEPALAWSSSPPQAGDPCAEGTPGRNTLFVFAGDARDLLGPALGAPGLRVLVDGMSWRVATSLEAWAKAAPAGWDQPGSDQRKALRAALGGRLVEWLARAER